jgi:hypothetical protein
MRQRSSAKKWCGGHASAAPIKPERSAATCSAGPVKLLLSRVRTPCLNRSVYPVCLHSPMLCGSNCARCLSQHSPDEVARQSSGAGAWKRCSGWRTRPARGASCPHTSGHGKPSSTTIAAGAKRGSGSGFSRFCFRLSLLLRLAFLLPLPNELTGAVVLRACFVNGEGPLM